MKEKNKVWKIGSVYAVLGVCLVAIGAAAWTTFDSISSTLSGNRPDPMTSQSTVVPTEEIVSGVKETSATQAEEPSEAPSNTTPEKLEVPVSGSITKGFSGETLRYSQTMKDWRVHTGTDFAAEEGEGVHSMADGTVAEVYDDGLLGNVVVIAYGDLEAVYCGLSEEIPVKVGDTVTIGQTIGQIGQIPAEQSDGMHLHMELRQNGEYQDLFPLLNSEH